MANPAAKWHPVTNSSVVFCLFLLLLAMVLYTLYQDPTFNEKPDKYYTALLTFATIVAGWLAIPGASGLLDVLVRPVQRSPFHALLIVSVVALAVFGLFAKFVLDAFPNSGDEVSYIQQAQTYARGRLWVDPPAVAEAFRQYWFFDKDGKWVGYFAPGWPLVMTPFFLLGLPLWIVNPLIGAASLPAFFVLARQYVSRQSAWLGMLLLGLSAFFIFNSGSYFSHSVTAFYGILFAICGAKYFAKGKWRYALAAGACIGLMGVTRTQNAVIFAAVFAAALLLTSRRRKGFLWFCLGGLPFFVTLLMFQDSVTGNALLPVQQ